jgi:GT2 family glycosyltransferase
MGSSPLYQPGSPLVSIVTPAYNAGPYIQHTLESAIRQTVTDFELLVVDDGSTDRTREIAESYAAHDSRIRVVRQPNRGIAAARNVALELARGQFLALLDSDDIWFPNHLEEQLNVLQQHPELGVLSANALNFGGPRHGQPLLTVGNLHIRRVSLMQLVETEDLMSIQAVFRREVVAAIGGFDENLRRSEDYDFWLRAALAGIGIGINPKPLGLYRRRPDSLSAAEALMLEAIQLPLLKLRQRCVGHAGLVAAIDRHVASLGERSLVARARTALITGDMPGLVTQFSALANETGASRYRVAHWLSGHVPATIRFAYGCKRRFHKLMQSGRRAYAPMRAIWAGNHLPANMYSVARTGRDVEER